MASINQVVLSGNVGQDPEVRTFEGGNKKARFSLATTKKWKAKDGTPKEETQWHRIEVWGNLAEIAENYVKSGCGLVVSGELTYETYTNKDGVEKTSTIIKASNVHLMKRPGDSTGQQQQSTPAPSATPAKTQRPPEPPPIDDEFEDTLPF